MAKKKKVQSQLSSPMNSAPNSEVIYKQPNLKAKNSDEKLNLPSESEPETTINVETMKKRSLVSLPGGAESEEEDEFLFIRLRKQIKSHWNKIMEHTSNGTNFFRSPQPQPEASITRTSSNSNTNTSTTSSITTGNSQADPMALLNSAIKSAFLIPALSCKRDDEGRRPVPFLSSLLQVNSKLLTDFF